MTEDRPANTKCTRTPSTPLTRARRAAGGGTCDILSYPILSPPHVGCGTTYDLAKSLPWTDRERARKKRCETRHAARQVRYRYRPHLDSFYSSTCSAHRAAQLDSTVTSVSGVKSIWNTSHSSIQGLTALRVLHRRGRRSSFFCPFSSSPSVAQSEFAVFKTPFWHWGRTHTHFIFRIVAAVAIAQKTLLVMQRWTFCQTHLGKASFVKGERERGRRRFLRLRRWVVFGASNVMST